MNEKAKMLIEKTRKENAVYRLLEVLRYSKKDSVICIVGDTNDIELELSDNTIHIDLKIKQSADDFEREVDKIDNYKYDNYLVIKLETKTMTNNVSLIMPSLSCINILNNSNYVFTIAGDKLFTNMYPRDEFKDKLSESINKQIQYNKRKKANMNTDIILFSSTDLDELNKLDFSDIDEDVKFIYIDNYKDDIDISLELASLLTDFKIKSYNEFIENEYVYDINKKAHSQLIENYNTRKVIIIRELLDMISNDMYIIREGINKETICKSIKPYANRYKCKVLCYISNYIFYSSTGSDDEWVNEKYFKNNKVFDKIVDSINVNMHTLITRGYRKGEY